MLAKYICVYAPGAYLASEDGPFDSIMESINVFRDAFDKLEAKEGLPRLYFVVTVRRNADLKTEGKIDEEKARQTARTSNAAYASGDIKGIAFLGLERENISDYRAFFNELDAKVPLTLIVGQAFSKEEKPDHQVPAEFDRERFLENIKYAAELNDKYNTFALWGLQDLQYLESDEDINLIKSLLGKKLLHIILTLTFDTMTNLISDIRRHPVNAINSPLMVILFATANSAFFGSSSVTFDALRYYSRADIYYLL